MIKAILAFLAIGLGSSAFSQEVNLRGLKLCLSAPKSFYVDWGTQIKINSVSLGDRVYNEFVKRLTLSRIPFIEYKIAGCGNQPVLYLNTSRTEPLNNDFFAFAFTVEISDFTQEKYAWVNLYTALGNVGILSKNNLDPESAVFGLYKNAIEDFAFQYIKQNP